MSGRKNERAIDWAGLMIDQAKPPSDEDQENAPPADDGESEPGQGRLVRLSGESPTEDFEADDDLLSVVEALIFAAPEPIALEKLSQALPRVSEARLQQAIRHLAERCVQEQR